MNTDAITWFYAGIVVQAVFLLVGQFERKDAGKFLACCAGSLIGFIPGKHETNYNPSLHLFMVPCIFAIIYALCFKEKILERINKEILMVWSLIGLYIAFQTPFITAYPPVFMTLLILSLLPIANAFAGWDENYKWKVYFYIWFLCVIVSIFASQFAFTTVSSIFGFWHHATGEINSWTVFLIGMSFLYLAVNLWYVIEIIPLPGKHQSFSERMEEVEEDMEILAEDYDDEQIQWWKSLALLILSATLLVLNYMHHFISDETLIPLLIVILPIVDKIKFPTKTLAAQSCSSVAPAVKEPDERAEQ
jgi:hypothetical protein